MTFNEMISALGIERYPDVLPEIFENEREPAPLNDEYFDKLQEELGALGARIDSIKLCAKEVLKNEALVEYTRVAKKFLERATHHEGGKLQLPKLDEATDLFHYPTLLLALAIRSGYNTYIKRGFPESEAKGFVSAFAARISVKDKNGNFSNGAYNWLRHYTSALLFNAGLFGVTPRPIDAPILILKNEKCEYKIIVTDGKYHKSGKVFGSAGCLDEEGSYLADFTETDISYTAREVIDSKVSNELTTLNKSEWKIVAKQWDWMVGLHIPRGADLSEESMTKGFHDAMDKTMKHYRDLDPKVVHCSTWLLSPTLAELCEHKGGITRFQNRFIKYPIKSGGKELFGFAFPSGIERYEDLPEETSLQRKLKALYVSGGFSLAHAGFVPDSDTWK